MKTHEVIIINECRLPRGGTHLAPKVLIYCNNVLIRAGI